MRDSFKLPLIHLATYSKQSGNGVSSLSMTFDLKERKSKVTAILDSKVERNELSDVMSEAVAFNFDKIIERFETVFQDTCLARIIISTKFDELGMDSKTLKVTCRFKPKKTGNSKPVISDILGKTHRAELLCKLPFAATKLNLQFQRKYLRTMDLIFDHNIDDQRFFQKAFSDPLITKLSHTIDLYADEPSKIQPRIKLSVSLCDRDAMKILDAKIMLSKYLTCNDKYEVNLINVETAITEFNQAIKLCGEDVYLRTVKLTEHNNKNYSVNFLLTSIPRIAEHRQEVIRLNLETSLIWQKFFNSLFKKYMLNFKHKGWADSITATFVNGRQTEFEDFELIKSFRKGTSLEFVQKQIKEFVNQTHTVAKIGETHITSYQQNVHKVVLHFKPIKEADSLVAKPMKVSKLHSSGIPATIDRCFLLCDSGYILGREKFVDV